MRHIRSLPDSGSKSTWDMFDVYLRHVRSLPERSSKSTWDRFEVYMRHGRSLPGTSAKSAWDMFEAMPWASARPSARDTLRRERAWAACSPMLWTSTRPSASGTLRKSGTYASFLWRPELQLGRWRMGHSKCREHELHVQRCCELQTGHLRVGHSTTRRLMTQSWMLGSSSLALHLVW